MRAHVERSRPYRRAALRTLAALTLAPLAGGAQSALAPVADSTPLRTWQAHRAGVTDARFSPDNRWLASSSLDGTVCVWRVPSFSRAWCSPHGAEVYAVAWSGDGGVLASTGGDARVVQWRASTGVRLAVSVLPHWAVTLAWRGDSSLIAPTVHGEIVSVARETGRTRTHFTLEKEVLAMALSSDGSRIATGVPLEVHELQNGQRVYRGRAFAQGSIAFSPRNGTLATAEWVAGAKLLNAVDGTLVQDLRLDSPRDMAGLVADTATVNMPSTDVAFAPDGRLLAVAGTDFAVWLWRIGDDGRSSGSPDKRVAHGASLTRVGFSPDGRMLVAAGLDRRISVWHVAGGR